MPLNVPQRFTWDGLAKDLGVWWTLQKPAHSYSSKRRRTSRFPCRTRTRPEANNLVREISASVPDTWALGELTHGIKKGFADSHGCRRVLALNVVQNAEDIFVSGRREDEGRHSYDGRATALSFR